MSHTFKKDAFNYWCWHCACCERLKKKKKEAFSAFKCSEYLDRTFFGLEVSKQAVYN